MSSHAGLLDGIAVSVSGTGLPPVVARWLLDGLGATVTTDAATGPASALPASDHTTGEIRLGASEASHASHTVSARLTGPAPGDVAGLPPGTLAYASGLALAGGGLLAVLAGDDVAVDHREVAAQILLPIVMAASYGTAHREPPAPRRIGHGYVACDLATADDEETFARMLESLGPRAVDPRAVADEAQLWRLPVCAFEQRPPTSPLDLSVRSDAPGERPLGQPGTSPDAATTAPSSGSSASGSPGERSAAAAPTLSPPPLRGVTVSDLTAMWAGPLTTWLLAALGADVHKVEPSVRFDGLRSPHGQGIHPPGIDPGRGDASGMFNALNRGKQRRDLDLRNDADRAELGSLVATSDLVIDSFSRRVMPNLGLTTPQLGHLNPRVATLSMPAFPAVHRWQVALGPGVHAAAGLGDLGDGRVAAPTVAYPDPLAGLTAFVESLALLLATRRAAPVPHHEVTLFDAARPLATLAAPSPILAERDPGIGQALLDDPELTYNGAWETVDDGAGRHRYPRCPFVGTWNPPMLSPAPPLASASAPR